ncbi:PH domain-containing protein [SAR202 cluster bacterium AD-804-J14_MRT_500m]|nr:PH domain-containing protein [SAR202 cluster bacterium AD-804-J14_MRT_500m]
MPQVTSSTPQEMDTKMQEDSSPATIPTDAIIVRQSRWAYMLYAIPALAFFGVISMVDFITFSFLPFMIASYFIVSRYLSFRRTAYILTDKHLVIFQGSLVGRKRFDIPFADLNYVQAQPGIFGSRLEYTGVILQLTDQRVFLLHYVPVGSPLLEYLRARMNPDSPHEDELDEKF